MASEIRVNKINSQTGVGTITLSPTGVDISGITTASTLRATTGIITTLQVGTISGDGSALTGVASTENIRTNTNATFLQNVSIVGTSTVTGNVVPSSDSATDIGTNSVRFQNAYVDTYYGDGSNLTGISAGTTLSGSTDNTVCTVTGANAIQGEANLTFDGTDLDILSGNSSMRLTCSSNTPKINFNANGVSDAARITVAESSGGATFKFANKNTSGTLNENFRIHTNGQASFGTTNSGYALSVINTTVQSNPTCYFKSEGFDNVEVLRLQNDRANSSSGVIAAMMLFYNGSGAKVGSIEGGTSTAYNTTSDYRLKENVVSISDGITRLKTLKPKRFNFIESPTVTVDGFLAHEVTAVPEAISGEKDAVDSNGEIDPQGLDQSKLVPLLTAALQEAVAKIEVLETKVAALEAASSN